MTETASSPFLLDTSALFALIADAVLVHKDPEYQAIASQVRQQRLPYKAPPSSDDAA